MGGNPVMRSYAYLLAHATEFVRYGSKPRREIKADPELAAKIESICAASTMPWDTPPTRYFWAISTPRIWSAGPHPGGKTRSRVLRARAGTARFWTNWNSTGS